MTYKRSRQLATAYLASFLLLPTALDAQDPPILLEIESVMGMEFPSTFIGGGVARALDDDGRFVRRFIDPTTDPALAPGLRIFQPHERDTIDPRLYVHIGATSYIGEDLTDLVDVMVVLQRQCPPGCDPQWAAPDDHGVFLLSFPQIEWDRPSGDADMVGGIVAQGLIDNHDLLVEWIYERRQ